MSTNGRTANTGSTYRVRAQRRVQCKQIVIPVGTWLKLRMLYVRQLLCIHCTVPCNSSGVLRWLIARAPFSVRCWPGSHLIMTSYHPRVLPSLRDHPTRLALVPLRRCHPKRPRPTVHIKSVGNCEFAHCHLARKFEVQGKVCSLLRRSNVNQRIRLPRVHRTTLNFWPKLVGNIKGLARQRSALRTNNKHFHHQTHNYPVERLLAFILNNYLPYSW